MRLLEPSRRRAFASGAKLAALLLATMCALAASAQTAPAQAPDELVMDGEVIGRRVPPKPGDICLVCNQPVDENDAVYLVDGQRVPLHYDQHQDTIREQLRSFLAQLTPRGAFLGAVERHAGLSPAWFLGGLYVLIGLIFGGLAAHRALHYGYRPLLWFVVGLAFSAPGYFYLRTRPKREVFAPAGVPEGLRKIASTYEPACCPACGKENHPSAERCLGCGAALSPQGVSEVARLGLRQT